MADINKLIQKLLEEYLAWNAISPNYAFTIDDIWGVELLLDSKQNYYFFGSKGSGKSSLVTIAERKIKKSKSAIPCVVHSSVFENDLPPDLYLNKVMNSVFKEIIKWVKLNSRYQRWKWLSTTYVSAKKYFDLKTLYELTEKLLPTTKEKVKNTSSSFLSQSRFELSAGLGEIELSALNAGILKFGNISITPIQLGFKISPDKEARSQQNEVNDIEGNIQSQLSEIVAEASIHLRQSKINQIVVLVDDFHILPVTAQLQIIKTLYLLRAWFSQKGIIFSYKIFSAADLSVDILNKIGLSTVNEIQYENIEASLDVKTRITKRRAMENRLVNLLTLNGISPDIINEKFPPEVINWVFTLSGGHFRRAWKIFSRVLDTNENYISYDTLERSAADVVKEFRDNLLVQVGIDQESYGINYKNWYTRSVKNMVRFFQRKESTYFLVSESDKNKYPELVQWINDAIAIGDVLEIAKDFCMQDEKNHDIHYWLLALNQATIRGELGYSDLRITYQNVIDLQMGLQEMNKFSGDTKKLSSKV